jgi:hypothetical protein
MTGMIIATAAIAFSAFNDVADVTVRAFGFAA